MISSRLSAEYVPSCVFQACGCVALRMLSRLAHPRVLSIFISVLCSTDSDYPGISQEKAHPPRPAPRNRSRFHIRAHSFLASSGELLFLLLGILIRQNVTSYCITINQRTIGARRGGASFRAQRQRPDI
jgi:hypothetical protein